MNYKTHTGASLIIVMMILVIVSLLGVGGAQIALMAERGARNDRDMQIAWQAAESASLDAEFEMIGSASTSSRKSLFDGKNATPFIAGCGTSGTSIGLCAAVESGKPAWLTVDFDSTASSAPTTAFGAFTGRTFSAGGTGVQPAKAPRYIVEILPDPSGDKTGKTAASYVYRVTSMGFGPRTDTQAVLQIIYRN